MAIAIKDKSKYLRAVEAVGEEDKAKLIEEYKRIGGSFVEGSNAEIEPIGKYTAIYDEEKAEEPEAPVPTPAEEKPAKKPRKKGKK